MTTTENNHELKEQFDHLILMGREAVPTYLEFEWQNYVNQYKSMNSKYIQDFYDKCNTIVKYLLKLKSFKSGRDIAHAFYQEFNYKSAYTKEIANMIAEFSSYPENVQFLQSYYEAFPDITKEDEDNLTERIKNIRSLNDLMKFGLTYTNAKFLSNTNMINIDINGQITPVMRWSNDIHCGINENNELVIYEQIGEDFDVVYLVKEDDSYTRIINRHQKFTPNGMIPNKSILTNEKGKVLGIEDFDILINPNFYDLNQKVAYYESICSQLATSDNMIFLDITQEAIKLADTIGEFKLTLCASLFDKLAKEGIPKKTETK